MEQASTQTAKPSLKQALNARYQEALQQVRRARNQAGSTPWLVAYDANAIQDLIAANSRPIAMKGTSALIGEFDRHYLSRADAVFAGGGRGMLLVSTREAAEQLCTDIENDFRRRTHGAVMATGAGPYNHAEQKESLDLLRLRLELAKDMAQPPGGILPTARQDSCDDCQAFRKGPPSPRPNSTGEFICDRCAAMIRHGQLTSENRWSLVDLSDATQVAVLSADGNNLGSLFATLPSLEACATVSALVGEVFLLAQAAAAERVNNRLISVASGGDDVRAFLAPELCIPYLETLTEQVEAGLETAAGILSSVLSAVAKEQLQRAGIGVGILIADATFPASRLISLAHRLEDQAKLGCRSSTRRSAFRSAVDLALMSAGELQIEAREVQDTRDGRPFSLESQTWKRTLQQATALKAVESSQRAWLAEMHQLEPAEALNLFRYQVARSDKWQHYFDVIKVDWRQKQRLDDAIPTAGLLTLAKLLEKQK